jgi:DNA-directed RNA polymerase I and III subunit RPAC2
MGNALRYAIMKNPAVEFCGYTIPHPSDAKMHLRIQTTDSTTALEALEKGFNDLMDLCDVVTEKFTASRDQFNAENGNRMEA